LLRQGIGAKSSREFEERESRIPKKSNFSLLSGECPFGGVGVEETGQIIFWVKYSDDKKSGSMKEKVDYNGGRDA